MPEKHIWENDRFHMMLPHMFDWLLIFMGLSWQDPLTVSLSFISSADGVEIFSPTYFLLNCNQKEKS